MEYLIAMLALGALCGCVIGAYVLFEGIEREQEEDSARAAERARRPVGAALWPTVQLAYPPTDGRGWATHARLDRPVSGAGDTATFRDVANREPLHPAMSLERRQEHRRQGWGDVTAHANRLDGSVRRLEERLDQLVRVSANAAGMPSGIAAQAE